MSSDQGEHEDRRTERRWCFRVNPKTALVVLVLLPCIWFGTRLARQRHAAILLARHNAVLDVVIENISETPAKTSFTVHPGERPELEKLLGRTWPDEATRRQAILEFGTPPRAVSTGVELNISESLADASAVEVAGRLADHYADGLADLGLERIASGGGASAAAVWKSPENDLDVWIAVAADGDAQSALVRIIFVDSQRLHVW